MARNPNWTRDEHLVALDYYLSNPRDWFDKNSSGVVRLARQVTQIAKAVGLTGSDTFRNTDGVSMKLLNFRRLDPNHPAGGLPRGAAGEKEVWDEFAHRPADLTQTVATILAAVDSSTENPELQPIDDEDEAPEGRVLSRIHRYRERNTALVRKKKAAFAEKHGSLFCEACEFDFSKVYGQRGEGFIECHHTVPVSELKPGQKTKAADLVLLCANCHRIVHAGRPWLQVEDLKALVERQ